MNTESAMSIPFVKIIGDKLTLQAALNIPDTVTIRVISILGKARMGKSTFLNAMASRLKGVNLKPFATQDDDEHCTRGIDAYYCAEQRLVLLDCQGLALEDSSHDPALLLFAYLISDIIIFNERMMLQNEALKLMEPICAFMTYLTMDDDVVKPRLYFRISDGDIVKDVGKNLEKVVFHRYSDQYQSIRDSIVTLFHESIGIVKTDTLDRAMKTRLAENNYLALFAETGLGFGAAVDNILAALPAGRPAHMWKALVPRFIANINLNEKITIDKLDVVGNAAKLELIEWISEVPDSLFAELPADGLQDTFDAHIKPRQNEKKQKLSEFSRKFKPISDTIKKPHYEKLAARLHDPIQRSLEQMVRCANDRARPDLKFASEDRDIILSNNHRSFSSYDDAYWHALLVGHSALRSAIQPLYSPVREYCETWLNKCYARLAFTLSDIIGLEVAARKAMEKLAEDALAVFLSSELERAALLESTPEANILLMNPAIYAEDRISQRITAFAAELLTIPNHYELKVSMKDSEVTVDFQTSPFEGTLAHDLVKPVYDAFVGRLREPVIQEALCQAITKHKEELLFGIGLAGEQDTSRIPDVEFVAIMPIHRSNLSRHYVTHATLAERVIPVLEGVIEKMRQEGYIVEGDPELLHYMRPNQGSTNVVSQYIVGAHPEPAVSHIFFDLYARAIALERVKANNRVSLYVEVVREFPSGSSGLNSDDLDDWS